MKKLYSILCLASLLLPSCSQEQDIEVSTLEKPVYLEVEVEPLSRATLLNDLPSECEYGIRCNSMASKVNYVKGKSSIVDPIQLDKSNQQVFAYYPWCEDQEYEFKEDGVIWFHISDGIDCLWGTSVRNVNNANPNATIQFHHVFTYVDFVIQPNQYLEEAQKKELIVDRINVGELPLQCLVDSKGIYQLDYFKYISIKSEGQSLADGNIKLGTLCPPSTDRCNTWNKYGPISIEIYFKGQEEPAVITIPRNKWSMEAGKKYTRYITINGRLEAELSETVSVTRWSYGETQEVIVK